MEQIANKVERRTRARVMRCNSDFVMLLVLDGIEQHHLVAEVEEPAEPRNKVPTQLFPARGVINPFLMNEGHNPEAREERVADAKKALVEVGLDVLQQRIIL